MLEGPADRLLVHVDLGGLAPHPRVERRAVALDPARGGRPERLARVLNAGDAELGPRSPSEPLFALAAGGDSTSNPGNLFASPARSAGMETLLDRIRRAPSIVDVFPLAGDLAALAAGQSDSGSWRAGAPRAITARDALIEATCDASDAPTAIAAIHALARHPTGVPVDLLAEFLNNDGWLTPHVAWSLAEHRPVDTLVRPLLRLIEKGRLGGMLAQQTLRRWSSERSETLTLATWLSLESATSSLGRARLVETLGVVGGGARHLASVATDRGESPEARTAAIAALGDRPGVGVTELIGIAAHDDELGDAARLALFDHRLRDTGTTGRPDPGLRIAQVHLGGRLDRELSHAGQASTGGIATLLIQLGEALAADPRIAGVTTVGRGSAAEAIDSLGVAAGAHDVVPAALGPREDAAFAGQWPALVAAERSLRRILAHRRPTVVHLRMADVGSLAAARLVRRQGLPIVFTLAPDPHALIAEMERSGELDRATFGPADAAGALWFRVEVVRRLTDAARQVVLFPRSELESRLRELLAIDVTADPGRYHVIPEGIDPAPARAARAEVARARFTRGVATPAIVSGHEARTGVLADLQDAVAALGPNRSGLPLVVSVGRLAELKGMARIAEAFATDALLRERANLVIVGGDLTEPSPEEQAEMDRIEVLRALHPEVHETLVMLGHRPHDDVLRVLAVAEVGLGPFVASGGAYVCGSRKEEFGLAIVEALAIGLPVVAPRSGGPASYVDDGVTGRLVDTLDRSALVGGIHAALDLATQPGRAERARHLVATRFTTGAMSDTLVPVYVAAVRAHAAESAVTAGLRVGPTVTPPEEGVAA